MCHVLPQTLQVFLIIFLVIFFSFLNLSDIFVVVPFEKRMSEKGKTAIHYIHLTIGVKIPKHSTPQL